MKLSVFQGESPLHTACVHGLDKLVRCLLEAGANPNAQTTAPLQGLTPENNEGVFKQTPLHLAISHKHEPVVKVFLQYKGEKNRPGRLHKCCTEKMNLLSQAVIVV